MDNEDGKPVYFEFDDHAAAMFEANDESNEERNARVEQVAGYIATQKLKDLWAKDFSGEIHDSVEIAVLYALEAGFRHLDGAWWNETLDVARLSAPRGVIFRSKLPEWAAAEVSWSAANG